MKFALLFILALTSLTSWSQTSAGIEYSESLDFNWSLFKGKVNSQHLDQWGNHTGAVTVSSIGYTTEVHNHQAKITIKALFNPNESWTKYPNLEHPDFALNHEKRHFQICEIYARKFRQIVSTTRFSQKGFIGDTENIFKKLTAEYRAEQNRYDLETKHSLDGEQQEKWNKFIDQQLVKLDQYKISGLVLVLD